MDFSMNKSIFQVLPLGFLGAVGLSLASIGEAKAFNFSESYDAGAWAGTSANTTGIPEDVAVDLSSTIKGVLSGGDDPADVFKILIDSPGEFTAVANTMVREPIKPPNLYLFDNFGRFLTSDVGASQSGISRFLNSGNYYLGIVKSVFIPTFNTPKVLTGWIGTSNSAPENTSIITYQIDLTHVKSVPTPALLPGLVGMGLSVWRKRKEEARV
jgi:hypothetical protein